MNLKQKTLEGVLWSAIQNWGSQGISLLVFLILARLLNPENWGLVAIANLVIDFMQLFLNQGFRERLIQKQNINDEEINTIFWIQILLSCGITLIIFASAEIIATMFKQPELKLVLQILAFVCVLSGFSQTQIALLNRQLAFRSLAIRTLFAIFISGIIGVLSALNGYGVWSLVAQQLSFEIVALIVLWTVSGWRPKLQFSLHYLYELWSFSSQIFGYKLVNFFNLRTDKFLIGYFFGEVTLGYYAIAHRILQVMTQLFIGTLNRVILPLFARLQKNEQEFLLAFYRATKFTCLIAFPCFLGLVILGQELMITFFGTKWLNAIPILQILAFTGILRSLTIFHNSAFVAMGKPSLQLKIGVINTIFNLIFCLVAIRWGIIAVALAYVISDYLVFPLSQWLVGKLISLSWQQYFSQFIPGMSCSIIMILTIALCKNIFIYDWNNSLKLIICFSLGIITYGLGLRILFPNLFFSLFHLIKQPKN